MLFKKSKNKIILNIEYCEDGKFDIIINEQNNTYDHSISYFLYSLTTGKLNLQIIDLLKEKGAKSNIYNDAMYSFADVYLSNTNDKPVVEPLYAFKHNIK